jgi:hypothetical protein
VALWHELDWGHIFLNQHPIVKFAVEQARLYSLVVGIILRNCFKTPDESENVILRAADEGKFLRDSGSYRLKICHSMPPEDGVL